MKFEKRYPDQYEYMMHESYYLLDPEGIVVSVMDEVGLVFDEGASVLLKHGHPEYTKKYFDVIVNTYPEKVKNDIVFIQGKFAIEELNKIIGICDYIGKFWGKIKEKCNGISYEPLP